MHDSFAVQFSDSQHNLGGVKPHDILWEALLGLEDFVELAAPDERHHEVESGFALEEVVHSDQEWVVGLEHDVFLEHSRLDLVVLDQHVLANSFDCVQLLLTFDDQFTQVHAAKRASAQLANNVEVLELDFESCRASLHDD